MSGQARRLAGSKHRDQQTTNLGALRVYASVLGRLNSRDNYQFSGKRKMPYVHRPKGQTFEINELGLTRADAHRFRTYQGDKWPPAIVVNFSPPRISEHERDELDLAVLEFKEARAIAEIRMRCEYGR